MAVETRPVELHPIDVLAPVHTEMMVLDTNLRTTQMYVDLVDLRSRGDALQQKLQETIQQALLLQQLQEKQAQEERERNSLSHKIVSFRGAVGRLRARAAEKVQFNPWKVGTAVVDAAAVLGVVMLAKGAGITPTRVSHAMECMVDKVRVNAKTADLSYDGDQVTALNTPPESCVQPAQYIPQPAFTPVPELSALPTPNIESKPVQQAEATVVATPTVVTPRTTVIADPTVIVESTPTTIIQSPVTDATPQLKAPPVIEVTPTPPAAASEVKAPEPSPQEKMFNQMTSQKIEITQEGQTIWGSINVPDQLLAKDSPDGWVLGQTTQRAYIKDLIITFMAENRGVSKSKLDLVHIGDSFTVNGLTDAQKAELQRAVQVQDPHYLFSPDLG